MLQLDRYAFDYAPFYCEENVWRLLRRRELAGRPAWALIVSSPSGRIVALRQKAGRNLDGLVHWDYHVLALVEDEEEGFLALDLDSDLPFPGPAAAHLQASFPEDVQASMRPLFRLLPASFYTTELRSDRSHMRRADGSWIAQPPPWTPPGGGMVADRNLLRWIDVRSPSPGKVLARSRLLRFLEGRARPPVPGSPAVH